MDPEIKLEALRRNPLSELSFIRKNGTSQLAVNETFNKIIDQFSHQPQMAGDRRQRDDEDFEYTSIVDLEGSKAIMNPNDM